MTVNILGTPYRIVKKKYADEPYFAEQSIDGFCDALLKEIVYCDMLTFPGWEKEPQERIKISEKTTIRHEIVHAFFNESGLQQNSFTVERAWAKNEEIVDWLALQGPKIYAAWKEADAL